MRSPIRRLMSVAAAAAVVASVATLPAAGVSGRPTPVRCGLTTLDGTIRYGSGSLSCGPAERLQLRTDLHAARKKSTAGTPVIAFPVLSDFQLADEESPLRGEFLDKCGDIPTKAAARWNDTLLPALINSEIKALDDIAAGPVTGRPFDFAVQLGDASDNQQYNEVRAFIDLLDGGGIVDPNSGGPGYDGNQSADPYPSPTSARLRDLANLPFWAQGIRRPDGSPLPWLTVAGNHDVKVRGTVPNDNGAWRAFARAWVTGQIMVNDLPPDQQQRVCADPAVLLNPTFWAQIAAQPNGLRLVPADPNRALVDRSGWIAAHNNTRGVPAGHGAGGATRCKGSSGAPLDRICYTYDSAPAFPGEPAVHFIALDTTPDEGLDDGNIDQAQWTWLTNDLKAHSAAYYTADDGTQMTKTGKRSSIIVLMTHHTIATMTNKTPRADQQAVYTGDALVKLLLRYPNVVAQLDGHTHANKITPFARPGSGSGFWEITTPSVADFPHQGRTIEIVDNHDGTMSIDSVTFDAAAPVDPAAMRWSEDPTPETSWQFGHLKQNVNEDMLASIARWVGARDPQSGAVTVAAVPANEINVQLLLKHPTGGVKLGSIKPPVFRVPYGPHVPHVPHFPFRGFPFPFQPQIQGHAAPNYTFNNQPPAPAYTRYGTTEKGLGAPGADPPPVRTAIRWVLTVIMAGWLLVTRVRRGMVGL